MSDSIYSFRAAPTYRAATSGEMFEAAMDMPMSATSTFFDQGKGGILESFGLGTAVRDMTTPEGVPQEDPIRDVWQSRYFVQNPIDIARRISQYFVNDPDSPALSEDAYKTSPYFRTEVPWDKAMTEDRAASLAEAFDAKKVREFYAEKRPFTAFLGNLGGQALDPINYIPVAGPSVKAAAVARLGKVAGASVTAALDAAGNTAIAALATSSARKRFGDDVSWQTTVSQIATAALIGSAFGAIGGALDRSPAASTRSAIEARLSTLKATQEARIALNEAIDGVVRGEDLNLSPNVTEPVARIAADAQRIAVRRASEVDRSWANATDLGPQTVVTPTGLRVGVRSEVVDALELVKARGDLQPRDRSRAASDAQIAEMAANLDPARLMFSPEADRGAPIVGPDNMVESGNGRVAALIRAAETNPEKFAAYKQALRDAGYEVPDKGIPVLISRRSSALTDAQRVQFVNDANTSGIAKMSATETAMMDVRAMTGAALDNYVPGDINSAANRAFVGTFMKNLPANERLGLVDADGRLNSDGIRRVENALIAAAYGDADVVARFAEDPDVNVKSIMGAMSDAAGEWAALRKEVAEGLVDADRDVTGNLTDALRFLSRAREKAVAEKRPVATVIKEEIGQLDILAGEIDPRTKAFVQAFYKNDQFTQANGRDIIAEHLGNIVRAARELGKPQLFGDALSVPPSEMIANARPQARQADIFGAGGSRESGRADGAGQEIPALRANRPADSQGFARTLDLSPARADPPPSGLPEAEKAIARPDDYKALASQYRVDPETGTFGEEAEIAQLATEGRLTAEDAAALDDAQKTYDDGAAYGEALKSVAGCLI